MADTKSELSSKGEAVFSSRAGSPSTRNTPLSSPVKQKAGDRPPRSTKPTPEPSLSKAKTACRPPSPMKNHTPLSSSTAKKAATSSLSSAAKHAIPFDLRSSRPSSKATSPLKTPTTHRPTSPAKHAIVFDLGSSRPSSRASSPSKTPSTSRPASPSKRDTVEDSLLEMGENGFVFKAKLSKTKIDPGLKKGGAGAGMAEVEVGNRGRVRLVMEEVGVVGRNGRVSPVKASPGKGGSGKVDRKRMMEKGSGTSKLKGKETTARSPMKSETKIVKNDRAGERPHSDPTTATMAREAWKESSHLLRHISPAEAPTSTQNHMLTPSRLGEGTPKKSTPARSKRPSPAASSKLTPGTPATVIRTPRHTTTAPGNSDTVGVLRASALFSPQIKKPVQKGARDIGEMMAGIKTPALNSEDIPRDQADNADARPDIQHHTTPIPATPHQHSLSSAGQKSAGRNKPSPRHRKERTVGTSPSLRSAIAYEMDALKHSLQQSFGPGYFDASTSIAKSGTPFFPSEYEQGKRVGPSTATSCMRDIDGTMMGRTEQAVNTPERKPLSSTNLPNHITPVQRGGHTRPARKPSTPQQSQSQTRSRLSTRKPRLLVDRPVYHPRSSCEEQAEQGNESGASAESIGRMIGEWRREDETRTRDGRSEGEGDEGESHTPPGSPPSSMLFFSPATNPLRHIHTPNPSTPLLRPNPKSRVAGYTRDRGVS